MAGDGLSRRSILQLLGIGAVSTAFVRRGQAHVPAAGPEPEPESKPLIESEDEPTPHLATRTTKLESFLKSRGIKPAHLARESGYSRQHLLRLRMGRMLPTKRCAFHLATACARLARERVRPRDLFDAWLPTLGGEA